MNNSDKIEDEIQATKNTLQIVDALVGKLRDRMLAHIDNLTLLKYKLSKEENNE
jgi:hypothetical protein